MGDGIKVLIVDDDEALRRIVSRVLKHMGLKNDSVGDGFMAMEQMKEERYDIIIADVNMPTIDGIQLLREVGEKYPAMDVIIMTGHSLKYSYTDVVENGAADFIMKPFSVEELKAKVSRILREKKIVRELTDKSAKLEEAYRRLLALEGGRRDDETGYGEEYLLREIGRLERDNLRLNGKAEKQGC